jgi:hypothetical protein
MSRPLCIEFGSTSHFSLCGREPVARRLSGLASIAPSTQIILRCKRERARIFKPSAYSGEALLRPRPSKNRVAVTWPAAAQELTLRGSNAPVPDASNPSATAQSRSRPASVLLIRIVAATIRG